MVRGCDGAAVRPTVRMSAMVRSALSHARTVGRTNRTVAPSHCRTSALLILFLLAATRLFAHDIPRDVTVQAFVKPDGHTLRVLVRVPLKGIQDIEYPRKERDFVDLRAPRL